MDLFVGLNPAQAEAVRNVEGPLLILAGAGSGKTKTLTHRIAHLIQNHGVAPEEILAVTFTNKAAKEMRERLAQLLGRTNNWSFMPYMGTFHGICVKILRTSGSVIGINDNFVIYDEADRQSLIRQVIKDLGLTKQAKPRMYASVISSAKTKMISVAEFLDEARGDNQKIIAKVYQKYEHLRKRAKALDFDDLLIETVRLLRDQPATRERWQNQFKYILIDEYQDTNLPQYQLVKLLVNDYKNICVVGDDWQSIYSWRGADFTNILNFKTDYPTAFEVKLEQNYRSTSTILDAAQRVIEKNIERSDKKIWSDAGAGDPVQVIEAVDEVDEANRVVYVVKEMVQDGYGLHDIAVLYRTNAQSYFLEQSLVKYKVPHKIIGGVRFFDRKEIKDVLAYLRLIYQPADLASFNRIINVPARGVGPASVTKFLIWQTETKYSLLTALKHLGESDLSSTVIKKFEPFIQIMDSLRLSLQAKLPPSEMIEQILRLTGYKEFVNDGTPESEDRLANITVLINQAAMYSELDSFLEDASLMSSADQTADDSQVSLMTIHAAKGLEFPIVIVVGMEDGVFPHARVFEDPRELEEERRLCYVAITRAKKRLFLTYATSRLSYGGRQHMLRSQFLSEIDDRVQPTYLTSEVEPFGDDTFDYNDFEIGDRVSSRQFGLGEVIDVDGLAVGIRFQDGKIRKLNLQYANLIKL